MAELALNLGGGMLELDGYVNVDINRFEGTDVVANLDRDFPFKDESVPAIFVSHVMEHLQDRMHFLKEAHRVLKTRGRINIIVPHKSASLAHHIDHTNYYSLATFFQSSFDEPFVQRMGGKWRVIQCRLRFLGGRTTPLDWAINLFPRFYDLFFPCSEIIVVLEKEPFDAGTVKTAAKELLACRP